MHIKRIMLLILVLATLFGVAKASVDLGNNVEFVKVGTNLGIGVTDPNQVLTINGSFAIKELAAPSTTADFGKIYVGTDSNLYFLSDTGATTMLSNGTAVAEPGGSNTHVQFNNGGSLEGTSNFTWDAANTELYIGGNLGIGSGLTEAKLHIDKSAAVDGSDPVTLLINSIANSSSWTTGAKVATLDFGSNDASGAGDGTRGQIAMLASSSTGGAYHLSFYVDGGSGLTELMRLHKDGLVGIGYTSPGAKLAVNGAIMSKSQFTTELYSNSSAATIAVDWNNSNRQTVTLNQAGHTVNFTDPSSGVGSVTLMLLQDATGSRTVTTWDSDIKWPSGVAPTLSTAASAVDIISCLWNGINYYCQSGLDFQ